jgi:serine-type D-Ala-D-Ala carboxypeptidase/endopeptidase (penicillin-binding protein 4)
VPRPDRRGRTLATLVVVLAVQPALAREPSPKALKSGIGRILERPAFASATWGIEVRSLASGKVLFAHDAGKNLKPASSLKLVTTAATLDALGPDARIDTTVETASRLDGQGRLLGDLFLVGRGDPNLSGRFNEGRTTAALEQLADALVAAGVRRIEGHVVGHEGLFRGERRGDDWAWDDLVWWYGAEVSALSFNDNCADLDVAPGERAGDPVFVDRQPWSRYYSVVSTALTAPAGSAKDLTLTRAAGGNVIRLSGHVPMGEPVQRLSIALEDPARYATTVFAEVLEGRGIHVSGGVETTSEPLPSGARVLATHHSEPLAEILKAVNKPSQNLHAEMLLRLLGARVKGEGSVEAGHEAVREFLRRASVSAESWGLQDGSGLSRTDLLTAHDAVSLLVSMSRHRHAAAFLDSLPVAGVDGTLKRRLKGTPAEGRIVAKTGTLRYANALVGYATTRSGGDRLAFAILVNNATVPASETTAAIDEIARMLVEG